MNKYGDYDRMVNSYCDMQRYRLMFEQELKNKQKELDEFIERADKRIKWLSDCEENKKYCILGGLRKNGKNKDILLIVRYEDGSQRDEKYSYSKIADARNKLVELKEKYSGVDWSKFEEEI